MMNTGFQHSPSLLTIDLDAITDNWACVRQQATHGRSAAVIKADGYGCGLVPVGRALADVGCAVFFVAHLDEALILVDALEEWSFQSGKRRPAIITLNGLHPGEARYYQANGIWPGLNDLGQIALWRDAARATEMGPLSAVIHLDTGMNRTGLDRREADILCADHSLLDGINMRFVMSHMACADEPDHPLNRTQCTRFSELIARLPKAVEGAMLAASSASFLGPDWHFDWLRPGVALFGGRPNRQIPNPLKPVVRLESQILQIREIAAGETVGYGASHHATAPERIATIAVGYADGYVRCLGEKAQVWIGEMPVPIVGRVSMDLITLDVTAFPTLRPGDPVTLIGPQPGQQIDDLADLAGTIGYEILTGLGHRFRRHYTGGAG